MSNYNTSQDDETTLSPVNNGSNLLNYGDYYDNYEEDAYKCPQCKGSGMDRYEEFECIHCFGEGYIYLGALAKWTNLDSPVYR